MQETNQPKVEESLLVSVVSKEQQYQLRPIQLGAFVGHTTSAWCFFGKREELEHQGLLDRQNNMRFYAYLKDAFAYKIQVILKKNIAQDIHWYIMDVIIPDQTRTKIYLLNITGLDAEDYNLIKQAFPDADRNSHSASAQSDGSSGSMHETQLFINQLTRPVMHCEDGSIILSGAPLGNKEDILKALMSPEFSLHGRIERIETTSMQATITAESNEEARQISLALNSLFTSSDSAGTSRRPKT
ncbi:MAG: hypothetical protein VXY77_03870 [Pseudomonadota bacterium]|nr:hypothetical protein [Pseudomonadota bacterium]